MRTINDVDTAITVLRILAAALTGAALLCWARAGWGMLCAGLSMVLAVLVFELNADWMNHLDTAVEFWVRPHRTKEAMAATSHVYGVIGEPTLFAAAVLIIGTILGLRTRSARPVGVLVAAVFGGVVIEQLLKAAAGRATDLVAPLQEPGRTGPAMLSYAHTFPSGHVTGTTAFLGLVAVYLGAGRSAAIKARLVTASLAGVLLVGVMAVYCRAHTVTDVIGGLVLGGAVVAVSAAVHTASAHREQQLPAVRSRPGRHRAAGRPGGVLVG